jgi:hypothetical protein
MQSFFKGYQAKFVRNFFSIMNTVYGKEIIPRQHANIVGQVFFRHFYPGFSVARLPPLTEETSGIYRNILAEKDLLLKVVEALSTDLDAYREAIRLKQDEALAAFLNETYTAIAEISGAEAWNRLDPASLDSKDILPQLLKVHQHQVQLLCFNLFKNVPISYEAKVTNIYPQRNMVGLKIHRYQATVIREERFTYLKSPLFPLPVRATLGRFSREDNLLAYFTHFEYVNVGMDERRHIRVEPRGEIKTVITRPGEKEEIHSTLVDISVGGLGVLTLLGNGIPLGEAVELAIPLRPNESALRIQGTVVINREEGQHAFLGVKILPDTNAEVFISQYVYQRQAEVVRELQGKTTRLERAMKR